MGAGPDGLDQSWGYADPKQAAAAGIKVVSMYLSHDPSKNVTAAKVKAYHRAGIAVLLNWESDAGRPLLGGSAGRADAIEAARQAKQLIGEVGYTPGDVLCIYFSCDRDATAAQIAGPVADYYKAAGPVVRKLGGWTFKWGVFPRRRFRLGVYGEADVVKYLSAHKITDAEWQTYAWSGGRLDPAADFYQYLNGQRLAGASVDFNHIVHADQLGAWWPPGHQLDSSSERPLEDDVSQKDVLDALASKEGQELIRKAISDAPLARDAKSPKYATHSWWTGAGVNAGAAAASAKAAAASAAASVALVTELGKRVAQQQAMVATLTAQSAVLQQQLTDLANGKVNVSGSIPATLTIGTSQ